MYCTADDVIAAVGQHLGGSVLGDMLGVSDGELSSHPDIATAVLSASRRIDSYLSVRYPVPLPVPAPSLQIVAEDLALYYLFRLRRLGDMEHLLERYNAQIAWLKEVSRAKENVPEMHSDSYAENEGSGVGMVSDSGGMGGATWVIAPSSQLPWSHY
jgi:phage gp36-like protein